MNIFIVDMIEGFARTGALASPRVEALIPKQVAFLEQIPQDSNVVFLFFFHGPDDSEFKRMPKHCEEGTEETEVCSEILEVLNRRSIRYAIVPKTTHSAFFKTGLDSHPNFASGDVGIGTRVVGDDWVMFGCVTDICITANVMEMDYRGKNVTLLRDLIDTYDIPGHDPKVYNDLFFDNYLPNVWGAKITTSEELLNDAKRSCETNS